MASNFNYSCNGRRIGESSWLWCGKHQQSDKICLDLSRLESFAKCTGVDSLEDVNHLHEDELDKLLCKFYTFANRISHQATRCYIKRIINDFVHAMGHEIWHSLWDSPLVYSTRRCAPCWIDQWLSSRIVPYSCPLRSQSLIIRLILRLLLNTLNIKTKF